MDLSRLSEKNTHFQANDECSKRVWLCEVSVSSFNVSWNIWEGGGKENCRCRSVQAQPYSCLRYVLCDKASRIAEVSIIFYPCQ